MVLVMAKSNTSEYEEEKYAVETFAPSGASVRLVECFGQGVANSWADAANEALPDGYEARVIKL